MRSVIVFVLILILVNCALVSLSESDKPQNVEKNRLKPEISDKYVVNPKSPRKPLLLSRREIYNDFQKKRCDSCRETPRCKIQGKCELCNRLCRSVVEPTTTPLPTEAPILGNVQTYSKNSEYPITESPQNEIGSIDKSGRYYTIGTFGPGPKQSLVARLLNISKKGNLERLVVLAKAKGKSKDHNSKRPIIIDTANVFKANESSEVDAEIYPVNVAKAQVRNLDLTSQIDRELDMAVQQKEKVLGESHLTKEEVDKVIDHALSLFNRKVFPPTSNLEKNMVQFQSRNSFIEPPHVTTKRSIPIWEAAKVNNEDIVVGAQKPTETSTKIEDRPQKHSQHNPRKISMQIAHQIRENKPLHKNVITKAKDLGLGTITVRHSKHENNFRGKPYLIKDDCTVDDKPGVAATDRDNSGEDLMEYEPRPPKYSEESEHPYLQQASKNFSKSQHPAPLLRVISKMSTQHKVPEILSIPINNSGKPESASQHVEGRHYQFPGKIVPIQPSIYKMNTQSNNNNNKAFRKPEDIINKYESDENPTMSQHYNILGTLQPQTEKPQDETYDQGSDSKVTKLQEQFNSTAGVFETNNTNHISKTDSDFETDNTADPTVGITLFNPPDGRHTDTELETPQFNQNITQNGVVSNLNDIVDNEKGEKLQISESKTSAINASLFTLILKNLEKKVENIADLVKKTCGKNPEDVIQDNQVALKTPLLSRTKDVEKTPIATTGSDRKYIDQPIQTNKANILGNKLHIIEIPNNDTTNFETITVVTQTEEIETSPSQKSSRPPILDVNTVVNRLQQGQKFLLDKALNMADFIQEGLEKPIHANDRAPGNMDRGLFLETNDDSESKQNPTIGCSKEDSEEYVEATKGKKIQNLDHAPTSKIASFDSRSGIVQEPTFTTSSMNAQTEETIGCSKEDSNEYLGEKRIEPKENVERNRFQGNIQNGNSGKGQEELSPDENVACSKESDEYLGRKAEEPEKENVSLTNKSEANVKSNNNKISEVPTQDQNKQAKGNPKVIKQNAALKDDSQNEEVGCSKEDSEEYVSAHNKETNFKDTTGNSEEAVDHHEEKGNSPYESFEYRNPYPNLKNNLPSLNSVKTKPFLRTHGLDKLFHNSYVPTAAKESSASIPKISKIGSNPNSAHSQSADKDLASFQQSPIPNDWISQKIVPSDILRVTPENYRTNDKPQSNRFSTDIVPSRNQFELQPQESDSSTNGDTEAVHLPIQQKLPIQYIDAKQNPPISSQSNKLEPPPPLEQRFADEQATTNMQEVGTDGFHVHRPKNLPNWPKLPGDSNLVRTEASGDDVPQQVSSTNHKQNPFSIFGRVVPQLNNTEISFRHIPSNKVYFVGTGMQLPLNMKKHTDGSYQLSVDVEKLCNTCTEELCQKKLENQQIELTTAEDQGQTDVEETPLRMQMLSSTKSENGKSKLGENKISRYNLKVGNADKQLSEESRNPEQDQQKHKDLNQLSPHRIEIVSMEEPIFRNRRIPAHLKHRDVANGKQLLREPQSNKFISEKAAKRAQERRHKSGNSKELKHQTLFDADLGKEHKHSELSKRSANPQLMVPSLTSHNRITKNLDLNTMESKTPLSDANVSTNPSQKFSSKLDDSLNRIDKNMRNYFDRRQKLENYYKNRNRLDLEHPDKKDAVKRRVTLVNNVLAWMKSIAVEDAHT